MKKLFESIGFIVLVCLSFIYTEKTVNVVKEYDEIMISIKEKKEDYEIEPIDAVIEKNTIIPGISGKKVNENKSYSKMKRYGSFNKALIVYDKIKPEKSIINNFDKYIIKGNSQKNLISLVFLVEKNENIDKILKILKRKKVKANFFINNDFIEKKQNKIIEIIEQKHNVDSLQINTDSYSWIDNKIKTLQNKKQGYCYNEVEDKENLEICKNYNNYTIRPNIIIKDKPLKEVKEKLESGSIISFEINNNTIEQLSIIIEYIKSRGYEITTLPKFLEE